MTERRARGHDDRPWWSGPAPEQRYAGPAGQAPHPGPERPDGPGQPTHVEVRHPPTRSGSSLRGPLLNVAAASVTLVVAIAALVVMWPSAEASPSEFVREAAASPGSDPFVPADQAVAAGSGDAPPGDPTAGANHFGIYGGSASQHCNPAGQVAFLQANPDRAAAFAEASGIAASPEAIAAHFATLTPQILDRDIAITNHGFRDGRPTPRPSILERGTAVLVDPDGIPRVRCMCGNPLKPLDRDVAARAGVTSDLVVFTGGEPEAPSPTPSDGADPLVSASDYAEAVCASVNPIAIQAAADDRSARERMQHDIHAVGIGLLAWAELNEHISAAFAGAGSPDVPGAEEAIAAIRREADDGAAFLRDLAARVGQSRRPVDINAMVAGSYDERYIGARGREALFRVSDPEQRAAFNGAASCATLAETVGPMLCDPEKRCSLKVAV